MLTWQAATRICGIGPDYRGARGPPPGPARPPAGPDPPVGASAVCSCSVHNRVTAGKRPPATVCGPAGEAGPARGPDGAPVVFSAPQGSGVAEQPSNRGVHVPYQAEYIWIDGTEPSPLLRSKTRIVPDGEEPGIWGFDGSSTNQALGHDSDCVLRPVWSCPDPLRGPDDKLVMCEVELTDFSPHPTNTRAKLRADRRPVRRPGADVRHRAGVHVLQGRSAARLAGRRLPGTRRAPTTAASAATRCPAARSWSSTPPPASTPASPSRAPTPR